MSAQFDALKQSFESYAATVEKMIADHKAEVDAAVAKAIAEHGDECAADMKTLQDEIAAAQAKLVPPKFESSNN